MSSRRADFSLRAASRVGALAAGLLLLSAVAEASTTTTTFNVTATVQTSCTVSATDMAFGDYLASAPSDTSSTSTITVTCSLLTPYTIGLNSGNHASGGTRRMASGTSRLAYELYSDPSRTSIFGTVAAGLGVSGIGTGAAAPTTVYGAIPRSQIVAPGSYADVITVTVEY